MFPWVVFTCVSADVLVYMQCRFEGKFLIDENHEMNYSANVFPIISGVKVV